MHIVVDSMKRNVDISVAILKVNRFRYNFYCSITFIVIYILYYNIYNK